MEYDKIRSRLAEFRNLPKEKYLEEHLFCLLTPQSNAQRCWQAVEELMKLKDFNQDEVAKILSTRTRFHNTKAQRILQAIEKWEVTKSFLGGDAVEVRNKLAKEVNGYGLKEAPHFLRNIGKSDNKLAILDRHILRNLESLGLIDNNKIGSTKRYLEIEKIFLEHARSSGIGADELDLLWWSQENGEIFK